MLKSMHGKYTFLILAGTKLAYNFEQLCNGDLIGESLQGGSGKKLHSDEIATQALLLPYWRSERISCKRREHAATAHESWFARTGGAADDP
jgi:hypothetical protein